MPNTKLIKSSKKKRIDSMMRISSSRSLEVFSKV